MACGFGGAGWLIPSDRDDHGFVPEMPSDDERRLTVHQRMLVRSYSVNGNRREQRFSQL